MRLIDADALITEINDRIDAAIKWGCNAIADGDKEIKLRAEQAVATFCEASLTAKKMPTIDPARWIPVSEMLPEANGRYLVTRGLVAAGALWNRVYVANYSDLMGIKSEKIWWQGSVGKSDFERLDDVVAWMPLPGPWRGEEDDNK